MTRCLTKRLRKTFCPAVQPQNTQFSTWGFATFGPGVHSWKVPITYWAKISFTFLNRDYILVDYLLFFADVSGDDEGQASSAAICKIRCLINFAYI